MKKAAIGIDIGGTNTVIGIVNEDGMVLVRDSINTPTHGDMQLFVDELSDRITKLIKSDLIKDSYTVLGIGIGAPNANYYSGAIEQAPNLSFKGIFPIINMLRTKFGAEYIMALTNDANAAALGEMIYGGAKKMKNFLMFTLGTGVGSGIVVNGDLVYGNDGFAGEYGHTTLVPEGRICGCGSKGHLETYCSATGMKRTAFELLSKYNAIHSKLAEKTYKELNSKDIYEAAIAGDKIALEVFEVTGEYLGRGLADAVHHLSPEAIFLFGGPVAAGDLIFKPTQKYMEEYLLPVFKNKVKILPSQLNSGDAAIVGASALVWKEKDKLQN